ncbi:MAG: DUF4836 family protein [Prevotellaceae bacterium]|jgi:hypothetical protein|nr:DUF4836 family protein [Prevotellaceae bacterium]
MKIFKFFFPLFLGCLFFTSCDTNVSTADKLSLIPGDASVVYEISGNEIFAKSGLNSPDNYNFLNFIKLMNSDAFQFIESLFKGSKDAGISADKILIYVSKLPDYAINISIADRQVFENWLKKAKSPEPVDEGEFRYISIDDMSIAWNSGLVVISQNSTREKLAEQFKPKSDGLLATNDDFKQFISKKSDLRLWLRYAFFADLYENMAMSGMSSLILGEYANILTHSYLNFEDGKIAGTLSLSPAEEVAKLKKKFPVLKESFDRKIFKDMPEQSYLALNSFVNVEEYVKMIRQSINTWAEKNTNSELDELMEDRRKEIADVFESPELKTVVEALGGDLLFSIHGFNSGIISYPLASLSFTVKGESAFKNILNLVPKDFYTRQNSYYSLSANNTFIPVYFAYKDDRVFVSNDLEAVKTFVDGPKGKTFADNPVSAQMTDKMMFYVNLDYETYPDNIKMLLQNFMGQGYKTFASVIDIYENMSFSGDTDYNFEFNLQLKNRNVNSLKQILKNLDTSLSSSWMR